MLDVGWSELILIGVVALIVIGPKDLPRVLREVGKFVRQARNMAGQFRSGFDSMMQEAEIEELRRKTRETVESINPLSGFNNPLDDFKKPFEEIKEGVQAPMGSPGVTAAVGGSVAGGGVVGVTSLAAAEADFLEQNGQKTVHGSTEQQDTTGHAPQVFLPEAEAYPEASPALSPAIAPSSEARVDQGETPTRTADESAPEGFIVQAPKGAAV
jgi:sec-independent protein translocase protein TatB